MSKWNDWAITTKFPPIKPGYGMNCRTDYKIDVVFKVRTGTVSYTHLTLPTKHHASVV
ncbi:hypothetical protein HUV16_27385, partial [Bacteroides ovatus]|nr:hypothetical protein [Bacteroides ovatus]